MFEFVGRCFNGDIWGFCSRKNRKYIDFGKEDCGGKIVHSDPSFDPAWDADVDALNEMEYNLVAEQPKGIKLELHDPEALESPRNPDMDEAEKNKDEDASRKALMEKSIDAENHNELTDLIQDEENTNNLVVDDS